MKPSEVLLQIKAEKSKSKKYGICGEFFYTAKIFPRNTKQLQTFMCSYGIRFSDWPEFSGNSDYPIKPYQSCSTASLTYKDMSENNKLWDRRYKYGKARWALLDWLIEQFQAKGA